MTNENAPQRGATRARRFLALKALAALAAAVPLLLSAAPAHAAYGDQPVIHSSTAVSVTTTAATLRSSVTFNERAAGWWFAYCPIDDCPDGTLETPHQEQSIETDEQALAPQTVQWRVEDLRPSTTYRVTVIAGNDTWHTSGIDPDHPPAEATFTFRTADPVVPPTPVAPSAQAGAATGVTASAATLNGTVVPGTTGSPAAGSSAYFEWGPAGGALDRATPPRSLPADAAAYPISAGLSDLEPGRTYRYRAVVVRNGQRHVSAERSFQTTAVPDCPTGATFETVRAGRIVAVGCFRSAGARWVAESAVRLNGVLLEPVGGPTGNDHRLSCASSQPCSALQSYLGSGNRFYLDRPGNALGTTGRWRLSAGPLAGMHTGTLDVSNVAWEGTGALLSVGADRSVKLLGFPLAGRLALTPHADGTSRLGALVAMPEALGGVTGETAVKVNPGGDLDFDRLRVEVGEVPVKGFTLGKLAFVYDRTLELWQGAAQVTLPTPSPVRVGVAVTVRNGKFNEFNGFVDDLSLHIAYGVYLQKVGATFGLDPLRLGGQIGISAGPSVLGNQAFRLDGSYLLHPEGRTEPRQTPSGETVYVSYPPSLTLTGTASAFSVPVREGWVTLYFTNQAWIELGGKVGIDLKTGDLQAFKLGGEVSGALRGSSFELAGTVGLTVMDYDVASASGVLNTSGAAGCGKVLDGMFAIGGYARWGSSASVVWYCDMARLRNELAGASARAAQAGGRPLRLPAGDRQALVRFVGDGGPPHARLHGPGGRTIDTPPPGTPNAAGKGSFVSLREDHRRSVSVLLANTGNGRWRYEELPGSAPIARVQTARPLPPVRVRAKVRRDGSRAVLRWRVRRIAGQRVTFMEEGLGAPPRVLARTRKARGSVRFRPVRTRERRRRVVALVEQYGLPRARRLVARYRAPVLRRVGRVRALRAIRRGGRVTVRWARMPAARTFQVLVVERTGRRTLRTVRRPRLVLRRARAVRRVTVRAVGHDLSVGRRRSAKVKRARAKPKRQARRPARAPRRQAGSRR